MDNSTTYNILDKAKNDLSKSGQDITNSINTFNDNLNKVIDSINPNNQKPNFQNKDQILKTSSDMEIFKESSSLTTSLNKLNNRPKQNIQIKNKIADPASDILCKKLQQKIDSLNYDNFVLNKKNKELTSNNDILNFELDKLKHNNKTEIMMFSEELDKALTFKNMKLNFFKSKFPQIIQNNYKIYNKNENQNNIKKIKIEKANENSMKSLSFHHKLLQMNKLKEILPIKKKDKQKIIENLKAKNNFKNGNGLIRSIIHINDKHSKSQVIKLPTLRIKTLDNDSEEDNDKFEQNFYNLIRKTQNRKGNRKSYDKIKSFNNPTKKVGTLLFNKKEKTIFEKKEKIPNKRKQIFHNEILYYSLK